MLVSTSTLSSAADQVTAIFEALFAGVADIRRSLDEVFTAGPVDAATALTAAEPGARRLLDGGVALGAGFVAAPDGLTDRSLYLAWWQGDDQQLLGESEAPGSGDPFDYTRREWFRVPARTGRRHVTGPYVDFVCTDEYVVTCTAPVAACDRMVGVVGADVLAETLERLLLAPLRSAGATLVGDHGRTIVSADHRLAPGTLVDPTSARERVSCADLPLTVALV